MSDQMETNPFSNPTIVNDPYTNLDITLNPDGSHTRHPTKFPNTSATPDPDQPIPVLSKDITINVSKHTWARIFLPRQQTLDDDDDDTTSSDSNNKLPLIIYYHAGGFVHLSAASTIIHNFCTNMALELQAVIVSIDYRLAPEHRLPAAYDDAMEAMHWIKTTQEEWLERYADFNTCLLMGTSSGANIVYNTGLQAGKEADSLEPFKIRGLILHQPFFSGSLKVESELRLVNDLVLPLGVPDLLWELALPIGDDRDHEYSNPRMGKGPKLLESLAAVGWRVLVTGCDGDPLIDRQIGLIKLMEEKGVKVVSYIREGGHHIVDFMEPDTASKLFLFLKDFIVSSSSSN